MRLSQRGASSLADDHANGFRLATICRFLSRVSMFSNDRWTSRSRRRRKDRSQAADRNVPQRRLEVWPMLALGRVKICGDYKSPLKNAAMTEEHTSELQSHSF